MRRLHAEAASALRSQTIIYGLCTALLTYAGERFVNSRLFACSADTGASTAWAFLLLPGVLLAFLAFCIESGLCENTVRQPTFTHKCDSTIKDDRRLFRLLFVCGCWWFWAFLATDYYACARYGPRRARREGAEGSALARLRAESQLIALGLFSGTILVAADFPWRLTSLMKRIFK